MKHTKEITKIAKLGYFVFALFLATILWITVQILQGCSNHSPFFKGKDGHSCYDTIGDVNNDGQINESDCQGPSGNDGQTGPIGPVGATGSTGSPGIGCSSIDVEEGVLIVCEHSTVLVKDGKNGKDGKDATPVKMIKFCPGVIDRYPSVFPEHGICLDNKIYAVYFDKTAFLSYLTPGQYKTTSVNSNCTFTVQENTCELLYP